MVRLKLTYMKLETIISLRMPWSLTSLVSTFPLRMGLQRTFNVPPPARILGPLRGEYDVR